MTTTEKYGGEKYNDNNCTSKLNNNNINVNKGLIFYSALQIFHCMF